MLVIPVAFIRHLTALILALSTIKIADNFRTLGQYNGYCTRMLGIYPRLIYYIKYKRFIHYSHNV